MKRATHATETPQVGRSVPRLESWLKVTGRAEYVHNLRLPGMLYGKIFRSSVAHGRIKHIDTSAARALAGVHSVVTAAEVKTVVPDPYYGGPDGFEEVFDICEAACRGFLEHLRRRHPVK